MQQQFAEMQARQLAEFRIMLECFYALDVALVGAGKAEGRTSHVCWPKA